MGRNPLLAETEQVGTIFHVIACSEKKVGNRHCTKFRSSAWGGKSFSAQLFSEFPERKIHYQILQWLAEGYTNKEIAQKLSISQKTAAFHVTNILKKLDVRSRQEAIVWVHKYLPDNLELLPG
jgi:DNA-binding NarL/FixJ family response regulator